LRQANQSFRDFNSWQIFCEQLREKALLIAAGKPNPPQIDQQCDDPDGLDNYQQCIPCESQETLHWFFRDDSVTAKLYPIPFQ
jgi:hypothetical protein